MTMKYFIYILIFFSLTLSGCCFKISKFLKQLNETEYSFNASIDDVKQAIKNRLDRKYYGMSLWFKEDKNSGAFSDSIFLNPLNNNDAFLFTVCDLIKSKKYYNIFGHLYYDVGFHIHLDSIDIHKTNVKIYTFRPTVITGYKFGLGDNYRIIKPCEKQVKPSTVEEYEILLIIGEELGDKKMPKLKKAHILPFGD